ncbi:GIY-YIG nuclease family protein [Nocardiopsis tropica]|nr:GIY-YIG nuclease family protein [Nocardiopsis tropica]
MEIAMSVIPEILRRELSSLLAIPTTPLPTPDAITVDSLLAGPHEEVVYFIANGGRVKIGFTSNLPGRLRSLSLRPDNVLTAIGGGVEVERALHGHFASHRRGNTEWFDLAPEIVRYITEVSKDPRPTAPQVQPQPEPQEGILTRALKVFEALGTDRATRSQLARQLTNGDEDELRFQVMAAGGRPPQSMRIDGKHHRGWYRKDIEEALTPSFV